jgi:glycosyltransferase involved in cell wall biosynthesis
MRVLFVVPPRFGLHRGGLEIQVEKTAEELSSIGVEVVKFNPWRNGLLGVDICHGFTFDGSILPYALEAERRKIPFIVSPVSNLVSVGNTSLKARVLLSRYVPGFYSDIKRALAICKCARAAAAQTDAEAHLLNSAFGIEARRIRVIPNGIESAGNVGNPDLFAKKYGVNDFVLCVGSIDENKNQETLIRAVAGTALKLVLVGRAAVGHEDYEQHCRAIAGSNVLFTGFIEPASPMISSAFAAARVVAVPSFKETWGLAMYEGALAGCHLAVSSTVPLHEAIVGRVKVVSPTRVNDWKKALGELSATPASSDIALIVQKKLVSWTEVAKQIRLLYEDVLNEAIKWRKHEEK